MTLLEHAGEFWSAANPATVVDRSNGRLWVVYLRSRPGCSTDTSRPGTDDMQTIARWSDNSGQSWSEPVDLTAVGRDLNDKAWRASVPGPGGAIQTRKAASSCDVEDALRQFRALLRRPRAHLATQPIRPGQAGRQ